MTLHEVTEAAQIIYDAADEDAVVTFGAVVDERIQGELQITVIATGFELKANEKKIDIEEPAKLDAASFFANPLINPTQTKSKELSGILDIPDFLKK